MKSQDSLSLAIFKAMIAKELLRLGGINADEFPNLISKISKSFGTLDSAVNPGDMIYLLDIITIDGGKIVLSDDGAHYLRIFEILTNNVTKAH
ncbi:MAG: hypothetical protein ACP5GY_01580 [Vulcanisaeta sp.]